MPNVNSKKTATANADAKNDATANANANAKKNANIAPMVISIAKNPITAKDDVTITGTLISALSAPARRATAIQTKKDAEKALKNAQAMPDGAVKDANLALNSDLIAKSDVVIDATANADAEKEIAIRKIRAVIDALNAILGGSD